MSRTEPAHMDDLCALADAGVFVGFASVPVGEDREFFPRTMQKLFRRYKTAVEKHFDDTGSPKLTEFQHYFYDPRAYVAFGRFDLIVLALVDSSEFANRTFQPYDPMIDSEAQSFRYQVLQGPTPRFRERGEILQLAKATFLSKDALPLLGVCQLKLNTTLLVPQGTSFLRLVIQAIKERTEQWIKERAAGERLEVLILESFSWHEITLLMFSNGVRTILESVVDIREMSFDKLLAILKLAESEVERIKNNTILRRIIDHREKGGHSTVGDSHVFEDSRTTVGCEMSLWQECEKTGNGESMSRVNPSDSAYFITEWKSKAGHLGSAILQLRGRRRNGQPAEPEQTMLVCTGVGDIVCPVAVEEQNTAAWLCRHSKQLVSDKDRDLRHHILAARTTLAIPTEGLNLAPVTGGHLFVHATPPRFPSLERERIQRLHIRLKSLRVSKILAARTLNMLGNFNEGIGDKLLVGSVSELAPFVRNLLDDLDSIEDDNRPSHIETSLKLQRSLDLFERGWRNRFTSSHTISEVTDFNVEFKSGVQQILTAIDGTYKTLLWAVAGDDSAFACIGTEPDIVSTDVAIVLNYFHIFQPAFFAAAAGHEAGHAFARTLGENAEPLKRFTSVGKDPLKDIEGALRHTKVAAEHAELYDHITPILFDHILGDFVSYYFTYGGNRSLYEYWMRGLFLTSPHSHMGLDSSGNLECNLPVLLGLLTRLFTVSRYTVAVEEQDSFDWSWMPTDLVRQTGVFVDDLFCDSSGFDQWANDVHGTVARRFLRAFRVDSRGRSLEEQLRNTCTSLADESDNFGRYIDKGIIPPFEGGSKHDAFRYVCVMLRAYLNKIRQLAGSGDVLLHRTREGRAEIGDRHARVLFDSLGGLFTHDPAIRRHLFLIRSAVTMGLWNIAVKAKEGILAELYGLD